MPAVVLVRTQLPENLGAVARAMGNFCVQDLRLVNPLCDPLDPKAIAMAAGNESLLSSARIFDTLKDATSDCHFLYATSARLRDMEKPYFSPEHIKPKGKTALIFGPERTGLTNDEIALCQALIQIPVNPKFSSLNIAQSVVVILYELFKNPIEPISKSNIATNSMRSVFLSNLEQVLDALKFWRTDSKKPIMWRNIQNIFTKHPYTIQEIRTLTGIMVDLLKRLNKS